MSLVRTLTTLALFVAVPAAADEPEAAVAASVPNVVSDAAPCAEACEDMETFGRALEMIQFGRLERIPEALVVAAHLITRVEGQPTELTPCDDCGYPELQPEKGVVLEPVQDELFAGGLPSAEALLDEAIAMARRQKRNALAKDWMALKKRGLSSPTRGAVGGVAFSVAEVEAFSTDIYQFDFVGSEPARVCMVGNGETTLGLYAYDTDGNRLDSARADRGGACVAWTPRDTARFDLVVQNLGHSVNRYYVYTN